MLGENRGRHSRVVGDELALPDPVMGWYEGCASEQEEGSNSAFLVVQSFLISRHATIET